MPSEIKPRFAFQTFCAKQGGWDQAMNNLICTLDSALFPCVTDVIPLPDSGSSVGQQVIDPSDNCLYTWDGAKWDKLIARPGMMSFDKARDGFIFFNGSEWVDFLDSVQLKNFLRENANTFYGFSSASGEPSGEPSGCFPFYIDTDTDFIWMYNFNNGVWTQLTQSGQGSGGTPNSLIESNDQGSIDNSFLSILDQNTGVILPDHLPPVIPELESYYFGVAPAQSIIPGSFQNLEFPNSTPTSTILKPNAFEFEITDPGFYTITAGGSMATAGDQPYQSIINLFVSNSGVSGDYRGINDSFEGGGSVSSPLFADLTNQINIGLPLIAGSTLSFSLLQTSNIVNPLPLDLLNGFVSIVKVRNL